MSALIQRLVTMTTHTPTHPHPTSYLFEADGVLWVGPIAAEAGKFPSPLPSRPCAAHAQPAFLTQIPTDAQDITATLYEKKAAVNYFHLLQFKSYCGLR